ncbi:MAG: hypothetical protein ABIH92_01810 [Nanoarchaeota archaeon]
MANKNLFGLLFGVIVLMAMGAQFAVATGDDPFGMISEVEVNGIDVLWDEEVDVSNLAGRTVPIFIRFDTWNDAEDVVFRAWISGEREDTVETEEFDVIAGKTYSHFLFVKMPDDLDELDESRRLNIEVESDDGQLGDEVSIALTVQRESHKLEILSIQMPNEARAGELVPFDVVVKNRGRQLEDDAFLRVRIPELGIETKAFFGDLPAEDCNENTDPDCDEDDDEDAIERRVFLRIPMGANAGLYTVEFQAFSDDALSNAERKLLVVGAEADTLVISSVKSKSFDVGETAEYSITVVNKGEFVRVYELSLSDIPSELDVDVSESSIVVPGGASRTVTIAVEADEKGNYNFAVSVHSEDGALLSEQTYRAEVEGNGGIDFGNNTTLLLTVVLAIVFIVLLVVLIVLLTRKPSAKSEGGNESSYY